MKTCRQCINCSLFRPMGLCSSIATIEASRVTAHHRRRGNALIFIICLSAGGAAQVPEETTAMPGIGRVGGRARRGVSAAAAAQFDAADVKEQVASGARIRTVRPGQTHPITGTVGLRELQRPLSVGRAIYYSDNLCSFSVRFHQRLAGV